MGVHQIWKNLDTFENSEFVLRIKGMVELLYFFQEQVRIHEVINVETEIAIKHDLVDKI